ncbi:hypothetical protein EPUS_01819 [Endocarpon pusillum Z07020]|uniref:Uncharacterized protein n=1 Tax=Endocarpon pusillum (strain Z07020 / HMAS-L-300199) TaxID=1263415 RepID=U1HH44_ENDPU|nr:uncharacterized protein EPUS_01819 [Endocarpon pusillum Z07020]ERF69490.1 hypothetical protein EPUS_01819 [Endocarpon pusillum Z07020]
MSEASPLISPAASTTSFSTACTSISPTEITQPRYLQDEEQSQRQHKAPVRNYSRPQRRREITSQTLLLSSPLATLIYTASSTAAALPLTSTTSANIPPSYSVVNEKGNVLRKKRASGGRPERLVRMGGPEIRVVVTSSESVSEEFLCP